MNGVSKEGNATQSLKAGKKAVQLSSAPLLSVPQFRLSARTVHAHLFYCPSGKFSKTISPNLDRGAWVGK